MPLDRESCEEGLTRAYDDFLSLYAEFGGHRFHGFCGYDDPRNYQGPTIWSEGDCQFRFALELERRFRGMVHVEVPLARYNVRNYDPKIDKRQFIDIVVSDLSAFDVEQDLFAERQHDLFVEVKYVGHGTVFRAVGRRTIRDGVKRDLERLKRNLSRSRCRAAALLLIDDNSYLEGPAGVGLPWDPQVRPLLASPTQLARRAAARTLGVALPPSCAGCGSPRVAAISYGMPTPEIERAVASYEVALGGCEGRGDGRDPSYRCLDCRIVGSSTAAFLARVRT